MALRLGLGLGLSGGVSFSPRSLFAASEPGFWYDPSDLTTLFQDAAGTTPVTAAGQSVGLMLDKSGRGNHATQSTSLSRTTYQVDSNGRGHLLFDGSDDFLVTSASNYSVTDKAQVFAGVRKLSDAAQACVMAIGLNGGPPSANHEQGLLLAPGASGASTYYWRVAGMFTGTQAIALGYSAPNTAVLSAQADIAADLQRLGVNGSVVLGSGDLGTGSFGTAQVCYIGRRSGTSLPFSGRIYSLIARFGPNLTADQIAQTEDWVNSKTGAY